MFCFKKGSRRTCVEAPNRSNRTKVFSKNAAPKNFSSKIAFAFSGVSRTLSNIYRSSHWSCCIKKLFLKISQNSDENIFFRVSFFNTVATLLKRETLAQTCFNRTPLVAASEELTINLILRLETLK